MLGRQAEMLRVLVSGVMQNEGFVRGFWSRDIDDPTVSVTFIVFETREQALSFREAVIANAPTQGEVSVQRASLRVLDVIADA